MKIRKKVLRYFSVCKPFFSEHLPLLSKRKPSINRVKITLKLTEK